MRLLFVSDILYSSQKHDKIRDKLMIYHKSFSLFCLHQIPRFTLQTLCFYHAEWRTSQTNSLQNVTRFDSNHTASYSTAQNSSPTLIFAFTFSYKFTCYSFISQKHFSEFYFDKNNSTSIYFWCFPSYSNICITFNKLFKPQTKC